MKWFNLLLVGVLAIAFNACQQHDKKELSLIDEASAHAEAASHEKGAKESPGTPGEAKSPTFFPK